MTSRIGLKASESILVGGYQFEDGILVPDEVFLRIDFLKGTLLNKVAVDSAGWQVLYEDPEDGRFWELCYPDSGDHGGGAPMLRLITTDEAGAKYRYGED